MNKLKSRKLKNIMQSFPSQWSIGSKNGITITIRGTKQAHRRKFKNKEVNDWVESVIDKMQEKVDAMFMDYIIYGSTSKEK